MKKNLYYMKEGRNNITTTIASEFLGLSVQRTRAILGNMAKEEIIIAEGANRKYKIKKE